MITSEQKNNARIYLFKMMELANTIKLFKRQQTFYSESLSTVESSVAAAGSTGASTDSDDSGTTASVSVYKGSDWYNSQLESLSKELDETLKVIKNELKDNS